MSHVFDYDAFSQADYQQDFWHRGRTYEHLVEVEVIRRFLTEVPGGAWFIDVGGGFGRLTPLYLNRFQHVVLFDYAWSLLKQAKDQGLGGAGVILVRGDLYHPPFREGVFNGGSVVRVLHHLDDLPLAFSEIGRLLAPRASLFLEFANADHLLQRLRRLCLQHSKVSEQLRPAHVLALLQALQFDRQRQLGSSLFRSERLKRIVSPQWLARIDRWFQPLMGRLAWTPSLFWRLQKKGGSPILDVSPPIKAPWEIFACPRCRSAVHEAFEALICQGCSARFPIREGIYDFVDS